MKKYFLSIKLGQSLEMSEVENPLFDVIFSESQRFQQTEQQPENEPVASSNQNSHSDQCLRDPIEPTEITAAPPVEALPTGLEELEDCLEDVDVELPNPVVPETEGVDGGRPRMGRLRRLVNDAREAQHELPLDDHVAPAKRAVKNRITVKQVPLPNGEEESDLGLPHDHDDSDGDEHQLQQLDGDSMGASEGRDVTERMADDDDGGSEGDGEGEEYWDEEDEYVEQLLNADKGVRKLVYGMERTHL